MQTTSDTSAEHTVGCRYCHSAGLRRSRLRRTDVAKVLLLRWPVRCLSCSKRQFIPFHRALRAVSSRAPHAPELALKESWQNYTRTPAADDDLPRDER